MFDLDNLRVNTYDHFEPHYRFRLLRDFTDAAGAGHRAGFEFEFDHAVVNVNAKRMTIHARPDADAVLFALDFNDPAGPPFGRSREWFEKLDFVPPPRPALPATPALPEGPEPPDAFERVVWLAGHHRFDEANEAYLAIPDEPEYDWPRSLGDRLHWAARGYRQSNLPAARWLAEHAQNSYYSWMSGASSGGEGAARQYELRNQLRDLKAILAES